MICQGQNVGNMPRYNPNSSRPVQITARTILKTMYNPPPAEDAFHFSRSKPDELKVLPPWSAELLARELQRGQDVSLAMVREALETLLDDSYVVDVPLGYELNAKGRREARRLGATGHQN
jgi:hypothetical protein